MGLFDRLFGKKSVELVWSYQAGKDVRSVAIGDGYVAAGSNDNKVYLFDYSGKLRWSYQAGGIVLSVAIGDGYVAGSGDEKVYLFDYSGKLRWSYQAGKRVWSVAIGDGYVAAGSEDNKVYLFNYSGKLLWSYQAGGIVRSVAIGDGYVAAGGDDKKVYLFDYSGKLLWSYQAGDSVKSVAIGDGYVAAGSGDNKVYLFDYSGKLLWSYQAGGIVRSVAIGDGYVAAGSEDDKVYLFVILSLLPNMIQKLIAETNQLGCKTAQPESLKLLEQGEYAKAVEIAKQEIAQIRASIRDFNELNNQIKSAESAIEDAKNIGCDDVTNPQELLNKARAAHSVGDYSEGIAIAKSSIEASERLKAAAKPEIALELTKHSFRVNYWEKADLILRNTGTAHAKAINLGFSKVAIKIPLSLDQATGRTFLKEIESWTRLNHSNIVRIFDYNILPIPFFEMELCDKSLNEYIKEKPVELKNACWIVFNTAEGLKLAHSLKIIHRDLKPQNILLKDGIPKITDWGLSKVMTQSASLSTGGFTPHYAAPEQISGKEKDERTDIYQLGVIFYQMTTKRLPFEGDTFMEIGMSITTKEPVRPSELNPEIDLELDKIILKSISKRPEDRYQSVRELQTDLAKYLQIGLKEELSKSISAKDFSRSAYYCGELFLLNLKINDGMNAYKYIEDLINYAKGDTKDGLMKLKQGIEYRIEKKMDIPDEIIADADILVHKVRVGG
jgi:serine/threonine protein kinase